MADIPDEAVRSGMIRCNLAYPRLEGQPDTIVVSLTDVRAADDLTITYDFDRDGWVVRRDLLHDDEGAFVVVEPLVEVGFFPAFHETTHGTADGDRNLPQGSE